MTVDLELSLLEGTTSRYSIVTIVFFASYIVFQPPATVICRYLGPRNFLSVIVVLWGAVMIGMGFADSYGTLSALRVILGVLEAGFFPSCVYLLSTWCRCSRALISPPNANYLSDTRFDIGKRYSCFYILGSLASACAGILAYGLMQLKGREGLNGWRCKLSPEYALRYTCVDIASSK
jgi:MFS family permease